MVIRFVAILNIIRLPRQPSIEGALLTYRLVLQEELQEGGNFMTNQIEAPVARVQMLIRKPVAEVFEALVDPAITSRFWFSKSSGRLEAGQRIRWDWEMYGHHTEVEVKE